MAKTKAFTLVELLVVITIISLLAGLLLPVLEDAIASARTMTCLSNLKQLMLSEQSYVDDNNGWTFMGRTNYQYFSLGDIEHTTYLRRLGYIVDKNPVIFCPLKIGSHSATSIPYAFRGYYYTFFKIDCSPILGRRIAASVFYPVFKETLSHTKFILYADSCHPGTPCASAFFNPNGGYVFNLRHLGSGTAAFADGHGACLHAGELSAYGVTAWYYGTEGFPRFANYKYYP